jgi:hypothetical protein
VKICMFGSRSLTWKRLPIFRALAQHALLGGPVPLGAFLQEQEAMSLPASEPLCLLNGDGPPGKVRGAVVAVEGRT